MVDARIRILSGLLALALVSGCGTVAVPPIASKAASHTAGLQLAPLSPAQPAGVAAPTDEPVPDQAALERLAAASPDSLTPDAPAEPGMSVEGLLPSPPAEDLGNFGQLDPTLWRGARPTDVGLAQLAAKGVKTIVNLENDQKAVDHERAWAEAHGIRFVSIPLSVVTPPSTAKIKQFLDLATDPTSRPLYFHCMQGRDRTGTAAFTYRVSHDGWKYDTAYAEMKAYHFHTYLLGLQGFLVYYAKYPISLAPIQTHAMTGGNAATLYVSPTETLPAIKQLITGAKRSVYLEAFCLGNDSYGKQLAPLLEQRAREGLDVKVLMDYMGSNFVRGHDALVKELRAAGVDVRVYNSSPIIDISNLHSINITHRKVYLADGDHGLVGGVNLTAPFDTTTQDLLIMWRGPVINQLYGEFAHDWGATGGTSPKESGIATDSVGTVTAQVVVTSPGERRYEAREAIFDAIDGAKQNIDIEQQYIWDESLLGHLLNACKRGVSVRILLPNPEQALVLRVLNGNAASRLQAQGADVRYYQGITATAHLHTKYFSVDDRWAITGSCNGDTRSLQDNQELDIVTTDPGLVSDLKTRLFERDWKTQSQDFKWGAGNWLETKLINFLDSIDYYF